MKEAIGGTLTFQIIMIFILIFVGIMAIGMNYATTFRAKNQVVHILEQYETYDKAKDHIKEYLTKVKYYDGGASPIKSNVSGCLNETNNYCIKEAITENILCIASLICKLCRHINHILDSCRNIMPMNTKPPEEPYNKLI